MRRLVCMLGPAVPAAVMLTPVHTGHIDELHPTAEPQLKQAGQQPGAPFQSAGLPATNSTDASDSTISTTGSHLTSCISLLAGVWGTLRSSTSFPVAEAESRTDWQGDQLRKRQKHFLEQAYQYASMADYAARLAHAAAKYSEAEADDACKQLPRDFVATKPFHQQPSAAAAVEAAITAADQIEQAAELAGEAAAVVLDYIQEIPRRDASFSIHLAEEAVQRAAHARQLADAAERTAQQALQAADRVPDTCSALEDVRLVGRRVQFAADRVRDAADRVNQAVVVSAANTPADEAGRFIADSAAEFAGEGYPQKLAGSAAEAAERARLAAIRIAERARGAASRSAEQAKAYARGMGEALEATYETTKEMAARAADRSRDAGQQAAESSRAAAERARDSARETAARTASGRDSQGRQPVDGGAANGLRETAGRGERVVGEAAETAGSAIDRARQAARETSQAAKEKAERGADKARKA